MDSLDIAEKELRNKAPAADTEQPAKKVKNNEVNRGKWNSINFARALLQSGVSGDACKMALYIHINQGGKWKFYQDVTCKETGLSRIKFYECLSELEDVNAIEREQSRNGNRNGKGVFLKWNFDYKSWKTKTESSQNEKSENEKSQNENYQTENYQTEKSQNDHCINIDKDLISPPVAPLPPGNSEHGSKESISLNSEHEEKREGAAAKPQPAPPPGTASKGSSFPETAQGQQNGNKYQIPLTVPEVMERGQTDLFGEAASLPEKPKKGSKGKGKAAGKAKQEFIPPKQKFTPPTLEEVIADIEIKLEKKGKREFWTSDQIRNFADDFMEHYTDPAINWTNKYGDPIQSWRLTLATWLKNVDYLPPERTTRNQPGQARGQVTTAARIMEMAGNIDPQRALEQRREQEIQKGGVIIED